MTPQDPTPQDPTSADRTRDGSATTDESGGSGSDHVMDMLGEHVPLSLLMDLTSPEGPDSETISADEGLPEDSWWDEDGEGAGGPGDPETSDARPSGSS